MPAVMAREQASVGLMFSKDRPLQLDAALSSFRRHCTDPERIKLTVLYRATSRAQRRAYDAVRRIHSEAASFVAEASFESDVRSIITSARPAATVLLAVDDAIFVRPFSVGSAALLLETEAPLLAVSLRLGLDTTYSPPLGRRVTRPELRNLGGEGDDALFAFRWNEADGYYRYPFDLSSSIYRCADLLGCLEGIHFDGPNLLEHTLWMGRMEVHPRRPELALHARARAFSAPVNRVQDVAANPTSGHERHSVDRLLDAFRLGWRVDVTAYDGFSPRACHTEVELLLRRLRTEDPEADGL